MTRRPDETTDAYHARLAAEAKPPSLLARVRAALRTDAARHDITDRQIMNGEDPLFPTVTPDQPQGVPNDTLQDTAMTDVVERRWIGVERVGPPCLTRLERVAEIWRDQGMAVTGWVHLNALEAAQARAAEVRRETVEECAQHLTTLADAMHEKAEAIAERESWHSPFALPLASERDAAVMAYDFEQAAAAIRALTDGAKGADHLPDAGNMIAAHASSSGEASA